MLARLAQLAAALAILGSLAVACRAATADLPKEPWAGGPAYWSQFPQAKAGGWDKPNFMMIGVWLQDPLYLAWSTPNREIGINTYVQLSGGSSLDVVRQSGMFAIVPPNWANANPGPETVGWILGDEEDMWAGPGGDKWDGTPGWDHCIPKQSAGGHCGFTVLSAARAKVPKDGRFVYNGFGKGVLVWHGDGSSAQFINNFTSATGADMYWYSDNDSCLGTQGARLRAAAGLSVSGGPDDTGAQKLTDSECHRASNYGLNIDRLRKLDAMDGKLQPIWGIVAVTVATTPDKSAMTGGERLQGAVWSSLIHGASGIIYFNHSFSPPCVSYHVLLDAAKDQRCGGPALRAAVATVNSQVLALAPILNTQTLVWKFNPKLDTMLKQGPDGSFYIFAQQNTGDSGTYEFKLPAAFDTAASAEVLNENRKVPVSGGKFSDSFAKEYTWHIYKLSVAGQ